MTTYPHTNKNIFLVGFMATGKSTVGKIVAEKLGYKFIDTDELIEKSESRSIEEIFKAEGESYFRELEHKFILDIKGDKQLFSTGGGLPTYKDNLGILRKKGVVIALVASTEKLLERLNNEPDKRPLLSVENYTEEVQRLLQNRAYFYISADYMVDTTDKCYEDVANEVIRCLQK